MGSVTRAALRVAGLRVTGLLVVAAASLHAQRPVVRGNDVWIGTTGDVRIAPRAVLAFTAEERRSSGLLLPRQLFGLVGLLGDIGGGVRVGGGYSRWHTSPNAEFGPRRATDEHRAWQQVSGSHRTLGAAWNHRFRYEQRWIAPVTVGNAARDWTYSTRARHQIRVVAPIDGRAPAASRLYLMPNVEGFLRVSGHRGTLFDQTRLGTAIGVGVLPRLNLEAGYMRQSMLHTDGAHELHHVVQVTGRLLIARRPSG